MTPAATAAPVVQRIPHCGTAAAALPAPAFGVGLHLPPRGLLDGVLVRPARRELSLAGALDRLLVLLGAEELFGAVHRGLGGRGVRPDAHGEIPAGLVDRTGRFLDLRLRLGGQADVLAGQPFGLLEVADGALDLVEHPGPFAVRLREVEPDLVEHLGRRPESLVRGHPILATARQQVGHAFELGPRRSYSPASCW